MFPLSPIVTASQLNCSVQAALLVFCSGAGTVKALQFEILQLRDSVKGFCGKYIVIMREAGVF